VAPGVLSAHDLEDVLRIETASFGSPWTRGHFQAALRSPFAWNPVLRRGPRAVAFACTSMVADEAEIQVLAVDVAERDRGLGGFLVRAVLREARRRGCARAYLEVRASNEKARRLYERLGFQSIGRRRGYYDAPPDDAILMSARLDEKED
jgi:ribosomal-protein-alanine N-acetyltransferase